MEISLNNIISFLTVSGMHHLVDHRPDLKNLNDVNREIETETLNAVLFASVDVIKSLKRFMR